VYVLIQTYVILLYVNTLTISLQPVNCCWMLKMSQPVSY